MRGFEQLLNVGGTARSKLDSPSRASSRTVQKLRELNPVGHLQYGLPGVLRSELGITQIEGLRFEEHIHQTHEDFTVVFFVDLTAVQVLYKDCLECVLLNFVDIDVVARSHRVDVFVDEVQAAALVGLVELVHLCSADWSVAEAFEDYCVEPIKKEM